MWKKDRSGGVGCRRSVAGRRKFDDPGYRGPERRNGQDRRLKGLAACVLAGSLLLGAAEAAYAGGRRLTDRPQVVETVLQIRADSSVHARPPVFNITRADMERGYSVATNDTNGYVFAANNTAGEVFTSIVVTTDHGTPPPEGSVEVRPPYQGPPPDMKRSDYKFYLSPGEYAPDSVVLARLLTDDGSGIEASGPAGEKTSLSSEDKEGPSSRDDALGTEKTASSGAVREENLNMSINPSPSQSRFLLRPAERSTRFLKHRFQLKPYTSAAFDFEFSSVFKGATSGGFTDVGAALATQVVLHELGHDIVADRVGATGSRLNFLTSKNGQFFMASSTVQSIEDRSRLPYNMGGEWAADLTFEYALESYRSNPSIYNKSLMFFSGTDMLWYSLYAFYLSDKHEELDPIAVTKYNNISQEAVLSVALAKTVINAYRIYSGNDKIIPHFTVERESVTLNFKVAF